MIICSTAALCQQRRLFNSANSSESPNSGLCYDEDASDLDKGLQALNCFYFKQQLRYQWKRSHLNLPMEETREYFLLGLFVETYFEKESIFPNNTGHFTHYVLSCLIAEIAYFLPKDNKQSSWSINLICFPGEKKTITSTWKRISIPTHKL